MPAAWAKETNAQAAFCRLQQSAEEERKHRFHLFYYYLVTMNILNDIIAFIMILKYFYDKVLKLIHNTLI
jgi:hypothetical protein